MNAPGFIQRLRSAASVIARKFKGAVESFASNPADSPQEFDPKSTHPLYVKSLIPRSHFTKKGPGVRRSAQRAIAEMTRDQRQVAKAFGWIR